MPSFFFCTLRWRLSVTLLRCSQKWPLLVLHGGPGLPSRYLETLELLAGQDRRVIFYDQVLSSRSSMISEICPDRSSMSFLSAAASVAHQFLRFGLEKGRMHAIWRMGCTYPKRQKAAILPSG